MGSDHNFLKQAPGTAALRAAAAEGAPVPSPCISVCRIDPQTSLCEGCTRTLEEIATWSRLDTDARIAVWERIEARRARA